MFRALDLVTSYVASGLRLGAGTSVGELGDRPEQPLELYDFEACPYCRKVREGLSILDLDVVVLPCPRGGTRYRAALEKRAGKQQFPYLVDPNTGVEMYESSDILRYLFEVYGAGRPPIWLTMGPVTTVTSSFASMTRPTKGLHLRPARAPERIVELYGFEASPHCRIVREELSSLEIPYLLHNVAKGSPKRRAFERRAGADRVPFLVDPNANLAMFGIGEIVAHLRETYAEA